MLSMRGLTQKKLGSTCHVVTANRNGAWRALRADISNTADAPQPAEVRRGIEPRLDGVDRAAEPGHGAGVLTWRSDCNAQLEADTTPFL